jgi:hypothetical protein
MSYFEDSQACKGMRQHHNSSAHPIYILLIILMPLNECQHFKNTLFEISGCMPQFISRPTPVIATWQAV